MVFLLFLFFNGCASVDEEIDCVHYLNQKEYSTVASDTSCSTYERASAEMGLAGFRFSNFLISGASDNFRQALGIAGSVSSWNLWPGKTHYENAMRLSGDSTGDTYEGQTRLKEDVEIHYFATLGALLAMTYIELDGDANGDVSEAEIQDFTSIRPSDDPDYGKNSIDTADWIQFVTDKGSANEKVYLLNLDTSKCLPKTTVPMYDGLWSDTGYDIDASSCGLLSAPDETTLSEWYVNGSGTLSISGECTFVTKIEEIQNLFFSAPDASSLSVLDLTEYFVTYANAIGRDMIDLGIAEDSDLRKNLREFSANIDNGATCSNDTLVEVDQIFSILNVAAKDATTDYENINLLAFDSASSASDTPVEPPEAVTNYELTVDQPPLPSKTIPIAITFACTNVDNLTARLIYKSPDTSADTYVPNYSSADDGIKNTFSTLKDLNTDASGDTKPDATGDEIISFKELLCMQ